MPVLAPQGNFPYDTVATTLGFAKTICNDTELSIVGDLLADAQPETLPLLNLAWREFQDELVGNGVEVLIRRTILTGFPPNLTNDPTSEAWIGWAQAFDGANYWPTPLLPPDMIEPLRMWQRQTGTDSGFTDMYPANDGLNSRIASSWAGNWDWRQDSIAMNGALLPLDFQLRYSAYYPDFVPDPITGAFPATAQVPVLRSAQALAYFVVATFVRGRGADPDIRGEILQRGKDAVQKMVNRTARKKQRANHRRRPYSGIRSSIFGW